MSKFKYFVICLYLLSAPLLAKTSNVTVGRFADIAYYPQSSAPASVVSLRDSVLSARIHSWVTGVHVHTGNRIKKNQVLLDLDCRKPKAQLAQLAGLLKANQAKIDLADYQLQRARTLAEKSHISEELMVARQSNHLALQAEHHAIQAQHHAQQVDVENCQIKSPFDAIVQQRMVSEGESVSPGTPLLHLVDNNWLELTAQISASAIDQLDQVKQFSFHHTGQIYPVELRTLVNITDPTNRSREIRLRFLQHRPSQGDSGRLIWQLKTPALPADYLVRRQGRYGVLIAENGQVQFKPLPHAQEGQPVTIKLPPHTLIIVKGRQAVKEGDRINIID